jgi:UDP-glucose 4-epimerase
MKILVTGAAGFIGSKVMYTLRERGDEVVGIDNFNDYYDVRLKEGRCKAFGIAVRKMDLADKAAIDRLFEEEKFDKVVNLAAQAGVRYSITNPYAYLQSNLVGFLNILEACRNFGVKHLVYASSSSVYGMNAKVPYSEDDKGTTPSPSYAATNEIQRADGPQLLQAVRHRDDRPAVLYRVRSLGPPGHGADPVCERHFEGGDHQGLQPWRHDPRLHLHRRHRRRYHRLSGP